MCHKTEYTSTLHSIKKYKRSNYLDQPVLKLLECAVIVHVYYTNVMWFLCMFLISVFLFILAVDSTCTGDADCVANSKCKTSGGSMTCTCDSGYNKNGNFCQSSNNGQYVYNREVVCVRE